MLADIARYRLTYVLIILNSTLFVLTAFLSRSLESIDLDLLVELGALFGPLSVLDAQWWRLLSAMFLHGGMTHILMNMFSLYLVGRSAERFFDFSSYLSIYLFSGLAGGLASLYMHPASVGVGASGAIFGLFGALAGFFLAHKEQLATHAKAFMKDFGVIILLNLVIGLSIPSVDLSAHIGGLVAGFLGGFLISKSRKFLSLYVALMVLLSLVIACSLPLRYVQIFY